MIEIKTMFSSWREVSVEQAREFVLNKMADITNIKDKDKPRFIEAHCLRGITVAELLGDFKEEIEE